MKPVNAFALAFALLLHAPAAFAQTLPEAPLPAWLQARIDMYKRLPPFSPPRSIVMSSHEGRTTYYVSPACCDIPSELYDADGRLICYPDGGFAGGDGRCPGFRAGRQPDITVWRDERAMASAPKR